MTISLPPISYPAKPRAPFTGTPPQNLFPDRFPTEWKNITGKPYITVSSKGLANGQSEYINDGADFGPDSLQADGTLTTTSGTQEAANYVQSTYPGQVVPIYLTVGMYYITSPITIYNARLIGTGITTTIVSSVPNIDIITIDPGTPPSGNQSSDAYHNVGVSSLAIWNKAPSTSTAPDGMIYVKSGYDIIIDHVWITAFNTANGNGITLSSSVNGGRCEVVYCWLEGINGKPINSSIPLYIKNNYFYICTDPVYLSTNNSKDNTIIDSNYMLAAFMQIENTQLVTISNNIISEPSFSSSQNAAITLSSISQAKVTNNLIDNQNGALASYGVAISSSNYVEVIDNDLRGNTVNGIQFDGTGQGNIFHSNTGQTSTPTLSTNPPVSATVYQNTNPYDIEIDMPVYATTAGTAGYVTIAKGATSTPTAIGNQFVSGSTSSTSTDIIKLRVPAGWYYSFTGSGVTFGTASVFAE